MDALHVLTSATKPGWRTSEFWVSIAAMATAVFLPHADKVVSDVGTKIAEHGTAGAIAAGAIAGAYNIGRAIVKATTAKALLEPVDPPVVITSGRQDLPR